MKQNPCESILRWRDRRPGDGPEDRAAAFIRGSLAPDEPQLARMEQACYPHRRHRCHATLGLGLAVAGMTLLVGVATVKAYQAARAAGWFGHSLTAGAVEPAPPPAQGALASLASIDAHAAPDATADEAAEPGEREMAAASVSERPRRLARLAGRPVVGGSPAPAPTAASEETLALDRALGLLRLKHDPAAALLALDAWIEHFPASELGREARFARVDALLSLDRTGDALAALEALPLDAHHRSTELQVIRGELRSRTDCGSAEQDFTAVLTRGSDAALLERALYGRGACKIKLGERVEASRDLQSYLERFPNGTHAAWARRWLETVESAKDGQVGGLRAH